MKNNDIRVIESPYPPRRELPSGIISEPQVFTLDWLRVQIPHPDQPGRYILAPLSAVSLVIACEFGEGFGESGQNPEG